MAEKTTGKKQKFPTELSPVGIAGFSHLDKPDTEGKYADNKFKITLYLDKAKPENIEWAKKVNAANEEQGGENIVAKDGDEENKRRIKKKKEPRENYVGKLVVTFKSKFAPDLVSTKRDPATGKAAKLPEGEAPRGGDTVKVAYASIPYEAGENTGVSLQLRAVQLVEKRPRGSYGDAFDADDDGEDAAEGEDGAGSGDF
jgi:hypothetical protein